MSEKRINSRLINKHDTEAHWILAENFTPMAGEFIIYDRDENYNYERFKIGDGTTNVNNLPFAVPDIDSKFTISGTVTNAVGGIAKNKVYTNADISTILSDLLFPYVKPSSLSISTEAPSGTKEYGTTVKVTEVTPTFTLGSKPITSIKIGTTSGDDDLYSGTTATSGTAITLTNSKTFDGTNGGTIYCTISDGTNSISNSTSVSYNYYAYSKLTKSTTASTSGATNQLNSDAANTYSYSSGQYLWLYSRSSNKKIQQYISGTWSDVNTSGGSSLTLTLASGAKATYYAYRTDMFTASGSAKYRLA
jgi:hypothetical protein